LKGSEDKKGSTARPSRREFLGRSASLAASVALTPSVIERAGHIAHAQAAAAPAFEFDEISISELGDGIANGRWTVRRVVEGYLERIQEIDRAGPRINAILELNPDALAIAAELDAELAGKGPRGPLHGVPILLKDSIGTKDRMHTSAGSLALANSFAPKDAHVTAQLRRAGAVIIGKANMSEWANARGRTSTSGWSGRGGLTRNPYALDRSPGGSSSGTAAAVASNTVVAAIGTETIGSIMSPAAVCGIVGLKPTVGLVSRAGIIPVSFTQDSVGPMTRTVRDAAILLSALAGRDPEDAATSESEGRVEADYTKFLDPAALKGVRIGIPRNLYGQHYAADRVIQRGIETLRAAGAVIIDPVEIETAEALWAFDAEVLMYELKAALNDYLSKLPNSPIKSLADIIRYNNQHAEREMRWFGQESFLFAQERGPLTSPGYVQALAMVRRLARDQGIDATMKKHNLDALLAPTQSPAWISDPILGDSGELAPSCVLTRPDIPASRCRPAM